MYPSPVTPNRVISGWGAMRGSLMHQGWDFPVPVGTEVRAIASGEIYKTGENHESMGSYVIIKHEDGTSSRYMHLAKVIAQRGKPIFEGEVIGLTGGKAGAYGAGLSTGPHLHLDIQSPNGTGRPVAGLTRHWNAPLNMSTPMGTGQAAPMGEEDGSSSWLPWMLGLGVLAGILYVKHGTGPQLGDYHVETGDVVQVGKYRARVEVLSHDRLRIKGPRVPEQIVSASRLKKRKGQWFVV
jgi:murein DD-endopeptidase MepM/ murein hydrolase activator NlpD